MSLKYSDVFIAGGLPRHTYNPRESLGLQASLAEVKENLCKLVTVTGQTKSGKTVLVRKVLENDPVVWIDGGVASGSEDELWSAISEELDAFTEVETEDSRGSSSELEAKGSAEAGFLVVKGTGEVGGMLGSTSNSAVRMARSATPKIAALRALRKARRPLVIDDFHYLRKDTQGSIIRALKPLIFDGLPVIIIAIPHRRYDAVKVEREMAGRVLPLPVPAWSETELAFIPRTGFALLGIEAAEDACGRFAENAIGSPHLMQDFCRGACATLTKQGHLDAIGLKELVPSSEQIFRDVADTIGRPIFEKLAQGPRARTDRIERKLKTGQEVDIYELVLHALASLKPGLVSLEYEDLRAAIRNVGDGQLPQLHEVARVLKHMATIASSDQTSTPGIDFEEDDKKLHITDPFFAFYLRWGSLIA